MPPFVIRLFWSVARFFLRLRYRVQVVGGEGLRGLRGPTLVMPNHPGYIDPPLVLAHVRLADPLRPAVTESMFRNPALYPMMRLVGAVEVPDLTEHSHDARQQTLSVIEAIVAGLQRGESFVLYPSGRTQQGGVEQIGPARAAAEILQRCPQINIVLVRTRGLWGSMFTAAPTGEHADLAKCFRRGVSWMAANLMFFAPRRRVTMTVRQVRRDELPGLSREELNPFLEDWYNEGGPETPKFVPFHFLFGPRTFEYPAAAVAGHVDLSKIEPATIRAVNAIIEEKLGRPLDEDQRRPELLLEELGLDSLDRGEIAMSIEDRFGFRSDEVARTLGQLWALAQGQLTGAAQKALVAPKAWQEATVTAGRTEVLAETLAEAFVRRALCNPDDVAVADMASGVLTYRRLLVATQLLGRRLAKLPGEKIGVLLPASAAADIVFFALHQMGKLPVMLNWTTGPANLAHAVKTLDIQRVVTSKKLIDRLGLAPPGAPFIFLEELRATVGKLEALKTLLATRLAPGRFLRRLPRQQPGDTAVILFTSGSESTPKAVPLTHANLICNVRGALSIIKPDRSEVMLGFLPPFHSFGLTGNVIAPMLVGLRVVHHPDPTDAASLVHLTAAYKASLLVSTPTFLSYMLNVARPGDLSSVTIVVTGAEKCPDAIFAKVKQMAPRATIVEGYGITECSPIVAANPLERVKLGTVGLPMPDVTICLVEPESKRPVPVPGTGLLLVRGPSIFHGYLNYNGADPFLEVDGHRWYVTGDLVEVDDEGYIHFRGRLKRFLKAGGEMLSLPALEEPIAERYPADDKGPQVAVEGIETASGRWIVLFTTQDISVRLANSILTDKGFRGVMRIDEVVRLDSIPVLGTGKTDYKVLRKVVTERVAAGPVSV